MQPATRSPFHMASPGTSSPSTGKPSVRTYPGRVSNRASARRSASTLATCIPSSSHSADSTTTTDQASARRAWEAFRGASVIVCPVRGETGTKLGALVVASLEPSPSPVIDPAVPSSPSVLSSSAPGVVVEFTVVLDTVVVSAAVNGGGQIFVRPRNSLSAAVSGGGQIRYAGNPQVSMAVQGGGLVRPVN